MKKYLFLLCILLLCVYATAQEYDIYGLYKRNSEKLSISKNIPAFVGLNIGIGGTWGVGDTHNNYNYNCDFKYHNFIGTLGLEVAGYLSEKFALGGYFSYKTVSNLSLGFIFINGLYNEEISVLWGFGYSANIPRWAYYGDAYYKVYTYNLIPEIKLGISLKYNIYMLLTSDFLMNVKAVNRMYKLTDNTYPSEMEKYGMSMSISIGYKFRVKKNSNHEE